MNQKLFFAAFFAFLSATSVFASNFKIEKADLQDIGLRAVNSALSDQVQSSSPIYWSGEWPTQIESSLVPVILGVGRNFKLEDEASAFTTGSVVNQLASLYFSFPKLQQTPVFQKIPSAVDAATKTFERYREGDVFNFYPSRDWKGMRVHQPIAMTLAGIWKGFTNIPEDADTTSVVYAALTYNQRLQGNQPSTLSPNLLAALSLHRDDNRNPHLYNRMERRKKTGSFLTWLMYEKDPKMPRFYFAQPDKGTRIPFNKNDVDCVVNLNVLRMLALNQTDIPGRKETCAMINDMIVKKEHATCGIYYPNTFNLAYSAATAQQAGESCFEDSNRKRMVAFILESQSPDGGWNNLKNIWNDRVQSTAYALNALLEFGDLKDRGVQASLRYGTSFLLRKARVNKNGEVFWNAEVFFTATAVARSLIVWRSKAYTTMTAAHVILKMQELHPELTTQYYFKLN